MGIGDDALGKGQHKYALDAFTKALRFDRYNPDIYRKRAGVFMELQNHDRCILDLENALRLEQKKETPDPEALTE